MKKPIIRVTKSFTFEAAHALDGYNGKCKDIHGHSYEMEVTVAGKPSDDVYVSHCGMVIDFGDIKQVVKTEILPLFDHRLVLRNDSRFKGTIESLNEKIRFVNYQPTCENMLLEIVDLLRPKFSEEFQLIKVFLRETKTSYAEWHLSDNR